MNMALAIAESTGPAPELPPSLAEIPDRVRVMEAIEKTVIRRIDYSSDQAWVHSLGLAAWNMARDPDSVPGVLCREERTNILLRLWAGCMSAAKTIALQTRAGLNTQEERARVMEYIDKEALGDSIYSAGVEAAPAFKAGRREFYSLRGVPLSSLVTKYRVRKWEM